MKQIGQLTTFKNYENLRKEKFYLGYNVKFIDEELKNISFLDFQNETDVILFNSGYNLIKHLTLNKNHHEKIKSLGYSRWILLTQKIFSTTLIENYLN